jgi:glycosyltransferase involved in cell wall biosynthesis
LSGWLVLKEFSRMRVTRTGKPSPLHAGRRLRVAHVALQLNMGGMEKLLSEFARHGDRETFDFHFVALGGRGAVAAEIEAMGLPVLALDEPAGLRPGIVLRLASVFRRLKLDVVHTHNTKPLLYAAPAARIARVPVVIHTRHGQRFESSRRDDAAFRFVTRFVDRVACVSQDGERLSVAEGVAAERLCTIWNGIDVSRFAYRGPVSDGPAVTVGRLSPEKDVATLVKAVALVVREQPAFRLEIAGDGPCMADLRRLATSLGLGDHVRFLGQVADIPSLLGRASLLTLSSVTEGISLTLLEGMARGLPVVATCVGGNPEVVVDERTGLLVPPKSPELLARAILRLRSSHDEAHRMGAEGRRRVEQFFDVRRMVADYEALYTHTTDRGDAREAGASALAAAKSVPAIRSPRREMAL